MNYIFACIAIFIGFIWFVDMWQRTQPWRLNLEKKGE